MAKQSWKQQMYQSIANSQVQQVMQQQREQGIAQLQAEFDAWQKQQNDIAQLQAEYDSWYAQNNPQPVQSAPVQTVKTTKPALKMVEKKQEIPSLVNNTADNLQYRQAKRNIALGEKRRESYQRQQQEEQTLASREKDKTPKERIDEAINKQTEDTPITSTRDMFSAGSTPTNNIKDMLTQQPEKKPSVITPPEQTANNQQFDKVAKIVEDAAKNWAPWFTYRGSKWENPYDSMTPEQQQIVRDYVQQNKNNPNLSEDERKRLGDFLKVYGGSGDVEDYNDIATAYNNTFSDRMQTLRAGIGGFVNANKPVADLMAKGASKLPIMGQAIDLDEAEKAYDASVTNAMDKNRAAAEIGRGAGQIYDYLITSPVVGAATSAMGLSGVGASAVNQLFQAGQDVALDVYPEAQRMLKEEGKINWGELAKRFGTDVALNVAMQVIPSLRGVNYDYLTKTVGNNADIFKNMTQSGAYKTIPDIANSIANAASDIKANEAPVENVAKMQMIPGMETEGAVVDDINRQFSDLMSNYQPETSAMRNIYNADDLNNSLNEQLANALRTSQAPQSVAEAQNDGIRVYRGFNRSDNPLEKNLAGEKSVYDALGKNDPNAPDMLPLNFYTESIDDAAQYANADKAFYESLGEAARRDAAARATENGINFNGLSEANRNALIKQYQDEAYRNLTGRNPNFNGSHVDEIAINPKKVLDISDLDEKVSVDDLYNRLSELTGVDKNTIDNRLMLSNVADENGMVSQYQILRNTGQTAGDFTGTRFVDFMLDHGYDAIKHKESGVNHYVTLNNAADTLKIPQFLSDATIENDILPYANALAEQAQSTGASRRFEKAYEDLWDYIYARRNELEPKWRDLSKIENELRSSAPNGVDVDSFINRINEVVSPYRERKISDIASSVVSPKNAAETVENAAITQLKTDIDEMSEAVTNRILDVGYKVDAANNEVLNQSYRELLDYEEKWAKTISESSDIAEIRQATKDLNNAVSRFNTRAKKVDPSIAKDIYNRKFSSMLNSFNTKLDDFYNGARRTEEATNLIVGDTGAKNTIEDMARQQVAEATNGFPEELKKLVEDRRHAAWEYGWAEGESVFSTGKRLDNIDKQIKEKYPEYVSQIYDDRGYFKNDLFDVEAVKDRLSKTMAEDTGIPKGTPEPESVKATYQIPDTPENAPTEVRPSVPDEAPNMKVSEAYTNTGRRGGGWNEAEYNKYTNPDDYLYESIDEVRSVEEATNMRLNEGRTAFKNRVLGADRVSSVELDGLMMEWRELTEEARALEEAGKDATDLWAESNKIFRKVQEQSTNNAQALQSLAKWSRNTPEGMLINAENIVNGKNKVAQSDLQKFIEKHFKQKKGNIEFSPEFERQFLETAEPLRGLSGTDLDTREAKEIMAKLGRMVNEQLPIKLNEKLQSFLMDNMLGNFRTLITRNAGGNLGLNAVEQVAQRPLAAGLDSLVSLKTGRRTQAGLSRAGLAEYISGFGKGLADEVTDFRTGLHTARSGENTIENAIRSNRHVFRTRVADGLDGLVKHGLSVGDRPYYEAVYKQTLGDYYRLRARGLMGEQIQALSDADFKLYAETAAKMNGLGAVYQQDSMLSNALMGFKKDVGMLSNGILGVDILSQFSMPFVKTPANVIERAIDYSPLGLIRNAFRTGREISGGVFDQNRFVNESARNILGTAMMGGGAAYAANGGLSGGYSDNANEKQAQREAGMQEHAWNVPEAIPGLGGKQMDISWLPVVGSNLVASAAAVDAYKNGEGNVGENLTQGIQAGGEALFNQSMFQGLQRLFGTGETYNSDKGIVGNMKNVVTSGVGQTIPSLLRQVAQVTDEYQRDTSYSNKGTSFGPFNTYAINSLANNIPGLRESYLAPKVDTSGNLLKENQGRNLGMKVLEDMILPGKITDVNMSPLAQEASRLSGATENAFIPKAKRDAIDSEEHTLTNEEWTKYQQNYYQQMTSVGNKLIDGDIYKNADEDAQAKILHDAYGAIRSALTSEYTGKEVTGAAKAYKEAGGGDKGVQAVVNYYNAKQLTDKAGLSSSSNAAKEIQEAVASGNTAEANQKASDASTILDSGINAHGYDVYKANKNSIKDTDSWISEYNKIDSLGNSDGFVSQEEFLKAIKKNNWSESEAVKYAKIYGTWEKIPYLKKDGTWGFHKAK